MRNTRSRKDYLAGALVEGRLMTELLLLILRENSTPSFRRYFRRISGAANLPDKLADAKADFEAGEINIRPDFGFMSLLGVYFLKEMGAIVVLSLRHPLLIAGGFRSVWKNMVARRCRLATIT
jgi:hypothetical protein